MLKKFADISFVLVVGWSWLSLLFLSASVLSGAFVKAEVWGTVIPTIGLFWVMLKWLQTEKELKDEHDRADNYKYLLGQSEGRANKQNEAA